MACSLLRRHVDAHRGMLSAIPGRRCGPISMRTKFKKTPVLRWPLKSPGSQNLSGDTPHYGKCCDHIVVSTRKNPEFNFNNVTLDVDDTHVQNFSKLIVSVLAAPPVEVIVRLNSSEVKRDHIAYGNRVDTFL